MPNSRISSRLLLALLFSLIHMKSSWSWIEPAALMGKFGTAFVLAELLDRASVHRLAASFARSAKPSHGSAAMQPGGPEVICCPSAIAIAAKRIEPASVQLARPIPVLIRLTPTTGCLTISHPFKWRCVGKTAGQPASQPARPAGFEPATRCLEGSCSIRLSYGRPVTIVHGEDHT